MARSPGPDVDSDENETEDLQLPPNAEAGPSTSTYASFRSFPKASYASVEYPSTVSEPSAFLRLVTQEDINEVFNAPITEQRNLEIRYGGMERNAVPVRGLRVPSQKLLLKVTRRRRRRRVEGDEGDEDGDDRSVDGKGKSREGEVGVFTSEVVGPISQTVRFRAMADFHYTPNPNGRVQNVIQFLKETDYDAILDYAVPPSEEALLEEETPPPDAGPDWQPQLRSALDLQPIPVFSERRVPLVYNYKNHSATAVEEYVNEHTGEKKRRYVNRMRFVTFALQKISHNARIGDPPKGPAKTLKDKLKHLDQNLLEKMRKLLEERAIWQRRPFLLRLTEAERHLVEAHKYYLPAVAYTFGSGPFWKTMVRYGYDPRTDPNSYGFQRIHFYLGVNRPGLPGLRAAIEGQDSDEEGEQDVRDEKKWEEMQRQLVEEGKRPPLDPTQEFSFDGQVIHRGKPDYQLCDITDSLIKGFIDDPASRTNKCDSRDGWYSREALELIKAMTRVKFEYIKKHNEPAPDSICYSLVQEYQKSQMGADEIERADSEELREIGEDDAGEEEEEEAFNREEGDGAGQDAGMDEDD